jgi:hypothetical protein
LSLRGFCDWNLSMILSPLYLELSDMWMCGLVNDLQVSVWFMCLCWFTNNLRCLWWCSVICKCPNFWSPFGMDLLLFIYRLRIGGIPGTWKVAQCEANRRWRRLSLSSLSSSQASLCFSFVWFQFALNFEDFLGIVCRVPALVSLLFIFFC